jgi:hypothetical protein
MENHSFYIIAILMLIFGIIMFTIGAWAGSHLSKDDRYEIYFEGYKSGYIDCQRGFLPNVYEKGTVNPIKKINPSSDLKLKFRG